MKIPHDPTRIGTPGITPPSKPNGKAASFASHLQEHSPKLELLQQLSSRFSAEDLHDPEKKAEIIAHVVTALVQEDSSAAALSDSQRTAVQEQLQSDPVLSERIETMLQALLR